MAYSPKKKKKKIDQSAFFAASQKNKILMEFVKDLADYGTRHDTSPTVDFSGSKEGVGLRYQSYIKGMDSYIRNRASQIIRECSYIDTEARAPPVYGSIHPREANAASGKQQAGDSWRVVGDGEWRGSADRPDLGQSRDRSTNAPYLSRDDVILFMQSFSESIQSSGNAHPYGGLKTLAGAIMSGVDSLKKS